MLSSAGNSVLVSYLIMVAGAGQRSKGAADGWRRAIGADQREPTAGRARRNLCPLNSQAAEPGACAATRDLITEHLRDRVTPIPGIPGIPGAGAAWPRLGGAFSALAGSLVSWCNENPGKRGTTLHRRTTLHPDDQNAPSRPRGPPARTQRSARPRKTLHPAAKPSTRAAVPAQDRDPARRQRPGPSIDAHQPSSANLYQPTSTGAGRIFVAIALLSDWLSDYAANVPSHSHLWT
jgi:hypothetical protein